MKLHKKHIGRGITGIIVLGLFIIVFIFFIPNGSKSTSELVIREETSYEQIINQIEELSLVKNFTTFKLTALILDFKGNIRKGKYQFLEEDNNFTIIKKLKRGQHYPVTFTFNNIRTQEQFLKRVNGKFLFEIEELENLLNNYHFLASQGYTRENVISVFIPNTYEFYYDIEAEDFFALMLKQHDRFWNKKKKRFS